MKVFCNNEKYKHGLALPSTDNKNDADIEIYVLSPDMTPTDLMKAFRACRANPMKSWYYISSADTEFQEYAYDAIRRGSLNIYHDWDTLKSSLSEDVLGTAEREVLACVKESLNNFGYKVDADTVGFIGGAVMAALNRYGAFPACKTFLQLLLSGKTPNVVYYNNCIKDTIALYASVENAVNEFRQTGSHILGVLAAEKIYDLTIPRREAFDRVTIHVLFQPITSDMRDLRDRRNQIVRVAKENGV